MSRRARARGVGLLVVGGPLGRDDVEALCERLRGVLERTDAAEVVCDVRGLTEPDATAICALARLQLTARRLGREIRFQGSSPRLADLVAFAGLRDVLRLDATLGVEPRREAEEREEALGVEEGVQPDDPAA